VGDSRIAYLCRNFPKLGITSRSRLHPVLPLRAES